MAQVVSELQAKGAKNVVASLQAGTVSFVAPGALAEETIRPYLIRLGRNASEVTMQVALVSVVMNENTSRGFDWSQFNFSFGAEPDTGNGTTPGTGLPGTGVPGTGTGTGSNTPKGRDRKSVSAGKMVSVRVDLGGRGNIQKKKKR